MDSNIKYCKACSFRTRSTDVIVKHYADGHPESNVAFKVTTKDTDIFVDAMITAANMKDNNMFFYKSIQS